MSEHRPPEIDKLYYQLTELGADPIHHDFSIARDNQRELIHEGHRYLITPRDDAQVEYDQVMQAAGIHGVDIVNGFFESSGCVIAEIPRDTRTLEQVAVSTGSEKTTAASVYGEFGRMIGDIALKAGKLPLASTINLHSVAYARIEDRVILAPQLGFVDSSDESKLELERAVATQLDPKYKKFGADEMIKAFKEGLNNQNGNTFTSA